MRLSMEALTVLYLIAASQTSCFARGQQSRNSAAETIESYAVAKLKSEQYSDAWFLFSSNFADNAGQYLIFAAKDSDRLDIEVANRNSKSIDWRKQTTRTEQKKLMDALKDADQLKSIDSKTFDGIVYTFIHYRRTKSGDDGWSKVNEIEMNHPQNLNKGAEAHIKLIDSISALNKLRP